MEVRKETIMKYKNVQVKNLKVFYRECGDTTKPTFLFLHGFPSASHMFRNLMPLLEKEFHCIAPDYIGFGQSDTPDSHVFEYTFEHLTDYVDGLLEAIKIEKFYIYVFDYGAPIGFRLAIRHPEKILGIVSQNGNVYEEGLGEKWKVRKKYWSAPTPELRKNFETAFAPETIIGQYKNGENDGSISPDGYSLDIFYSSTKGYAERQDDLILDYRSNVALYPEFQKYLRFYQPKLLAAWGKNDSSFVFRGAEAFLKDDDNAKVELLDGGHFVLESHYKKMAQLILSFFR